MKKIRKLLAVLSLSLVLAGCGAPAAAPSGEEQQSSQESGSSGEVQQSSQESGSSGEERQSLQESGSSGAVQPESQESTASSEGQQPAQEPQITIIMVGDILLHTPVAQSGETADGGYDFSAVFEPMREEIAGADLALVNQEVIIGGKELGISGYPAFNAPYELGDALVEAGFDVVCQATNHALDKGKRGIINCLSYWREKQPQIAVLGIHDDAEGQNEIYVYEQQGIRIAVLNYTYGTNGIPLPQDMPYAVDLLEKERVKEDLARAGEMADFVIVCPHWGTEYRLEQTKEQEQWAALFAENGADLVIGTHPHVIEPVEWAGDTLVYYSLGNFVNWTSGTGDGVAARMVGGMAKVTVGRDETGEVCILENEVEPLVCHVEQGFGGVTVYPLAEYTQELAGRNEIVKQDGNFSLSYCTGLVQQVFKLP